MSEHELSSIRPSARGSDDGDLSGRAADVNTPHFQSSDDVVQLPVRPSRPGPPQPGKAPDPPHHVNGREDKVVDLRAGADPRLAAGVPQADLSTGPAPEASVDLPSTGALERGDRVNPPVALLSSRVTRQMVPTVVAVGLTVLLASGALLLAFDAQRESAQWDSLADAGRDRSAAAAGAWAGVVGLVAGGVGQPIDQSTQVDRLLGEAGAAIGLPKPDGAADAEMDLADERQRGFVTLVRSELEQSGRDPVELGNTLTELDRAREGAVVASAAMNDLLGDLSTAADARSTRWLVIAVCCMLGGVAVSVALGEQARRRLRSGLDPAVSALGDEIELLGTNRPAVVGSGFEELTWLVDRMHARGGQMQSDMSSLRRRADWEEQSRRLTEALELAESEAATYSVIERALGVVADGRKVELLFADRGSSTLRRVAVNPNVPPPSCPVGTTSGCVAVRRGQVSVFDSSESINACPKLVGRESGPCSAVCVPVTVAGRPMGVIHMTDADGSPPNGRVIDQVVDLATRVGSRFSALRALESSRQEASTDGLTGLPNRRALEARVAELIEGEQPFVMVLGDLDRFKLLNDNFGHETGDRALQLFAGVLRDNVRGNDVVARLGGEEFVLVYPNMSVETSLEAVDRVRAALAKALDGTTLPRFTCSFGIAHSSVGHDGDAVLRIADAGMLQAKDQGGDQAVVSDADLEAVIFADDAPVRARREGH